MGAKCLHPFSPAPCFLPQNDDYNQQTHPTAIGGQHSAKIPTKGRLATALTPTAWGLPGGEVGEAFTAKVLWVG